jgi:hypothetical protein
VTTRQFLQTGCELAAQDAILRFGVGAGARAPSVGLSGPEGPPGKSHMNTIKRFSVAFLFATAGFATSALALAETPKAEHQCDGHGKGKGEGKGHGGLFKKADKNQDGFLTKDEVGDQRWDRIKVADANHDNKVSKDELKQARKDGKLPKPSKPSQKA